MLEIKVTVNAEPALMSILGQIVAALSQPAAQTPPAQMQPAAVPVQMQQPMQQVPVAPTQQPQAPPMQQAAPTAPTQMPAVQQPVQSPQAAPVQQVPTTAPSYTQEQLAIAATQLVDAGRKDAITGLLGQFGVQALTQLPKEQYGAFATQLRALGAKI